MRTGTPGQINIGPDGIQVGTRISGPQNPFPPKIDSPKVNSSTRKKSHRSCDYMQKHTPAGYWRNSHPKASKAYPPFFRRIKNRDPGGDHTPNSALDWHCRPRTLPKPSPSLAKPPKPSQLHRIVSLLAFFAFCEHVRSIRPPPWPVRPRIPKKYPCKAL
jgi:hypothetical protein